MMANRSLEWNSASWPRTLPVYFQLRAASWLRPLSFNVEQQWLP